MSQPLPPGDLPSDLVPPLPVNVLVRPPLRSSPLIPGGSFRVDLEQAPRAIEDLKIALQELGDIEKEARRLGNIDATSRDSVSLDMASALGRVAVGGAGSLVAAVQTAMAQIEDLIHALDADLASYRHDDANVAGKFDGSGQV